MGNDREGEQAIYLIIIRETTESDALGGLTAGQCQTRVSLPPTFSLIFVSDSLDPPSSAVLDRHVATTDARTDAMSHRGSMGPPPDKEMALGGPQMHYAPTSLANGGSVKVGGVNSYDVLAEKYSRLKRRYFDLEQVGVSPRYLDEKRA